MVSSVVASQLCSPEGRASHQEGPPDSLPLKDTHAGRSEAADGLSLSQGQINGEGGCQRLVAMDTG